MTNIELSDTFSVLHLTQADAAQLLGVSARTVRRWFEGEVIPGPAEAALRAWRKLQSRNLAWRPDSMTIVEDDQEQIALHRNHTIGIADLLERVDARGGARTPWQVDVAGHEAKLGPIEVGFYLLQSGGFSLSTYTRRDRAPDTEADWPLIEDAAACIASELGKWAKCAAALRAAADNVRETPQFFVQDGPASMKPDATAERIKQIVSLAGEWDKLADAAMFGEASYAAFEAIRDRLQKLGALANGELVSAVAHTFHNVKK